LKTAFKILLIAERIQGKDKPMMRRFAIWYLGLIISSGIAWAQPAVWEIDPAHSSAQFSVRHMMVSNVRGEFGKVAGRLTVEGRNFLKAQVEATIDAASIDTRNEARDKHLRSADFFEVDKYPTITFKSKRIESSGGRLRMIGDLTMRGVTKEVSLDVDGPTPEVKDPSGTLRMGASATATVNRKDFNILWNKVLDGGGVVVGDQVAITIDVELIKR
jgi:polyisoprenoid-binding protein YceI